MSIFAERLRTLRKKNNISQIKLSKYFNYGSTAIANYESGRNEPSYDVLIKIADYFNVSIDYLLGREEEPLVKRNLTIEEDNLIKDFRELDKNIQINLTELIKSIKNNNTRK